MAIGVALMVSHVVWLVNGTNKPPEIDVSVSHQKPSWANWDFVTSDTISNLCTATGVLHVRLSLRVLSQTVSDKAIDR